MPEHVAKRNLIPPLRALLPLIASSGRTALSAELRLAQRYHTLMATLQISNTKIMKSIPVIFTFLLVASSACHNKNQVQINCHLSGNIPNEIFYSVPIHSLAYGGFKESINPDSSGNFQIILPIEKNGAFIILMIPGIESKILVAEPSDIINISVDMQNGMKDFEISGSNKAGQYFYNT
ncbi:MAG: hypothetical protein GX180_13770, partial [Enterococcus sp.]|nr:hypothetical protein [Enterococcus sp.]